jgi:hypothetical protein
MKAKKEPQKGGYNENLTIYIRAGEKVDEEPKEFLALLFNNKKELLERTLVKNDKAVFKTGNCKSGEFKLLLAPNRREIKAESNYNTLIKRHKAYDPVVKQNQLGEFEILPIPDLYIKFWWIRKCRVKGNVTKNFDISGYTDRKGLCNVRVHICEVDRLFWLLPRIPDHILVKIPDLVLRPEIPFPVPVEKVPPFPPLPDPVLPPLTRNIDKIFEATSFERQEVSEMSMEKSSLNLEKSSRAIQSNREVMQLLQTRNPATIRETILENFKLFHPIFCITPWLWPYFYKCDEIKVVYTDENGDFDTNIIYSLFGDHPDLYFWVEAFIDGQWETVYRPPLPCNIYWNYPCGLHVNINVTDPRVEWDCATDLNGKVIWVKTIRSGTSISHIEQNDVTGSPIQGESLNRQGLTDRFEGSGNYRRPFGSKLYFKVQFSDAVRSNEYTYYRWSYRKVKHGDLSLAYGAETPIDNPAYKLYSYTFTGGDGFTHIGYSNEKLGPVDVGTETGLYHIPTPSPTDAPFGATEANAKWQSRDTWTISFDSNLDGDGLYEFTLELFDKNGNKVTNIPNELFQVPHYNTFAPSVLAPSVNLRSSGAGTCNAFKMVLRLDNSHCTALISKIKVDGVEKNPTCCGFVPFTPTSNIEIKFRAYHPNNFADLSFTVQKGTCSDSAQSGKTNARGMVIGDAITNDGLGYSRNSFSEYTRTFTPADLLGICNSEGKAAFAEYLYVNALAINGNNEINAYDASKLAAFALEPE